MTVSSPEGVVRRADQQVGAGLAGGIGAVRCQRGRLAERRVVGPERAVDLVGGDLDVAADLRRPRRVEQALGADDVGVQERRGVVDRAVDVALGGEVHDRVEAPLGDQALTSGRSAMSPRTKW